MKWDLVQDLEVLSSPDGISIKCKSEYQIADVSLNHVLDARVALDQYISL